MDLKARIRKLPLTMSVAVTGLLYELGDRRLFPEKELLDLNEHSSHPIAGVGIGLAGGLLCEA